MERYDLSKNSEIREFAKHCNGVIRGASQQPIPEIIIEQMIRMCEHASIWSIFHTDFFLWERKYSVMLSKKTRNTFEYYRGLSKKEFNKEFKKCSH